MIQTIFFDIGQVILLDSGNTALKRTLLYDEQSLWADCKTGKVPQDTYLDHAAHRLGLSTEFLVHWKRDDEYVLNVPLVEWIRWTATKHNLHIIAVSNADWNLEERLEQFGVADLFEHVVNSARVGIAKPDSGIYYHALTWTPSLPQECLFVDDKPTNIEAAERLGMKGHVYRGMDGFLEEVNALFGETGSGNFVV